MAGGDRLVYDLNGGGGSFSSTGAIRSKLVSFLQDMGEESELRTVPSWKAHQLTGDRKGTWSLFVTRNWRITESMRMSGCLAPAGQMGANLAG